MTRIARWFGRIVAIVTLSAVALILAAYLALTGSLPKLDGAEALRGLREPVKIERDDHGVPTVYAKDRLDLARATGFLHAQDRYFQMDLLRRSAAGELSELFGESALAFDRQRRLHRMRHVADEVLKSATPDQRALLDAYAAGVNAGLKKLRSRPFEYWLLRAQPKPWTAQDSVLCALAMWFDLTDEDAERDARLGEMFEVLPRLLYRFLVQPGSEWDAPVTGTRVPEAPLPGPLVIDLRRAPPAEGIRVTPEDEPVSEQPTGGSNSFAIAGWRSDDGGAWLANDMHLGLAVPNTWYRARLVLDAPAGPGSGSGAVLDITGVTLPGLPMVAVGSNRYVAWGFTNSYGDWSDRVLIESDPGDPGRYRVGHDWQPFTHVQETIHVRGGGDVTLDVRETVWGPVIGQDGLGRLQAVHWLGAQPEATNLNLVYLEQAHSIEEAMAVANSAGLPPQNFIVADRDGRIAWTIAGRVPKRAGYDPNLPSSWADPRSGSGAGAAGWRGWLAPGRYPHIVNPKGGRLWSANTRVTDMDTQALLGDSGYDLGARAMQIRDDLAQLDKAGARELLGVQLDDRAVFLSRWHDLLLKLLDGAALAGHPLRAQARTLVTGWGAHAAVDSAGYRIVREWRAAVEDEALAGLTQPIRARMPQFERPLLPQFEGSLWTLVTVKPEHLLDARYPDWNALMLSALDRVLTDLSQRGDLTQRTWGERNTLLIRHPLSPAVPWLSRFLDMPRLQLPGDTDMPRVQGPRFGAAERIVVSPGHEERGIFEMPGGESGNPLSPFYRAGFKDWAEGRPAPFLPAPTTHRLKLSPKALKNPP